MKIIRDRKIKNLFIQLLLLFGLCFLLFKMNYEWLSLGLAFAGTLILVFIFLHNQLRRIESLTFYLKTLNRGDYTYDLDAYVEGELAILHAELNKTTINQKTMNDALVSQKAFLNKSLEDISHQLKTPITSLSILNELQNQEDELVQNSRIQISRLDSLVKSLLKLVQLDAHTMDFNMRPTPLDPYLFEIIETFKPLAHNSNLLLNTSITNHAVLCDPNKTMEAFQNILSNKLRYAKTTITITTQRIGLFTEVRISDDGDAIPISQREKIFERFYSGANKHPESVGIGLSLAREIMNQQGGVCMWMVKTHLSSAFKI
ncbi:HAMP domain-containing histidine kinase [Erysipelothrix sp. HDW6C]|uniref:sensor histidine kinase n=1 Tax=Erysipelothrix sp. HDW6C TaxID=2714930 RepID=UPI00140B3C09|nr:HAMP domain-containing sensor histidine kinase [Erysipelothrix sp. HDW6C]QIK69312.1 HAMP domain-containing histidine kinase [Erysipelothrix sp. HDW6C]